MILVRGHDHFLSKKRTWSRCHTLIRMAGRWRVRWLIDKCRKQWCRLRAGVTYHLRDWKKWRVVGGIARVPQRVVVLHGKEVRVPARSCLFIAKNKIHLILLLLIGDSFWILQVMPPKILSGQSKKIEKIYKFSQNSEISGHQFGNSNHNSNWICYY